MRCGPRLHLVRDKGKAPDLISAASAHTEARYLNLADTALNQKPEPTAGPAGGYAHKDHEALKQELLDTLEQLQREGQIIDDVA
jgi:hypothetical protein